MDLKEFTLDDLRHGLRDKLLKALAKNESQGLTPDQIRAKYPDDKAARTLLEQIRWPNGIVCPHCGNHDQKRLYQLTANADSEIREGLKKCEDCRNTFTVTVGSVIEGHHQPLDQWLQAIALVCLQGTTPATLASVLGIKASSQANDIYNKLKQGMGQSFGAYQGGIPEQDFYKVLKGVLKG
jgi:transposase-like protein